MRSGALLGFGSAVSALLFVVACGSSDNTADDSLGGNSFTGGSAGSVSLTTGGTSSSAGSGGHAGASAVGVGGHAGSGASGLGGSSSATGGTGGSGSVCPPTTAANIPMCTSAPSGSCASCVCSQPESTCPAEWNACATDAGCARALACVLTPCATALCAGLAQDGQTKLVSLLDCLAGPCATSCNILEPQGGAGSGGASAHGAGGSGGTGLMSHGGGAGMNGGGKGGSGGAAAAGAAGGTGFGGESGAAGSVSAGGASSEGGAGGGSTEGGTGGDSVGAGGSGGAVISCDATGCDHDLCTNGVALGSACSTCAYSVCAKDGYCCDSHGFWDDTCVAEATIACGCGCDAGAGGGIGAGGTGGSSGASSGGSGGTTNAPPIACTAPATTPSKGACVVDVNPSGPVECNPITGAPCDVASGAVCDVSFVGGSLSGFHCYGGTNSQPLCGACGISDGFCSVGLTCTTEGCAKFCCDGDDCGAGASCDMLDNGAGVGVCVSNG